MNCEFCKKNKIKHKIKKYDKYSCLSCYKNYFQISKECIICQEYNKIKSNSICEKCYYAINPKSNIRPIRKCSLCNNFNKTAKFTELGPICYKCYKPPKRICSFCKEEKFISKKQNNLMWCKDCYIQPNRKCENCNNITKIRGNNLCDKCYEYPKYKCFRCNNVNKIAKYINNNPICIRCYNSDWLKIETNRLKQLIRKRIRDSLNRKIIKKDFNIDYEKIIEHLGPKPDGNYHIDHIFPLSAFNFEDPKHISLAFAPENHQWLESSENLKKYNKFDRQAFKAYLENPK